MIATAFAVLALASGVDLGLSPSNPKWQTDYAQAMINASAEKKPMAVFIGHGNDMVKRMTAEGVISADAAKLLAASYVCIYLDTDTASGKDWAGRFEITQGLVISNPGGTLQAYRYTGNMPATTLTRELTHYASAGQPSTTVSAGVLPTRPCFVYTTGGCANGSCQTIIPASGVTYPYGSSCPSGRCPYQR